MINKVYKLVNENLYWTNSMGIARSLLALATLLTFLTTENTVLFNYGINNELSQKCAGFNSLSIFCMVEQLWLAKTISCIILFLVIIGIYPRLTAIFHWWISYSFANSSYVIDGGDQVASILSLFLILLCLFDRRTWHWTKDTYKHSFYEKTVAFFVYIVICLQVSLIYLHSFIGKCEVTEWVNGTALYYWFNNSMFGANEFIMIFLEPILKSPILLTISTWGVLLLELFLAYCILVKNQRIRKIALIIGILFHFGIVIAHGLVSFFFVMAAALILYLNAKNYNYVWKRNK